MTPRPPGGVSTVPHVRTGTEGASTTVPAPVAGLVFGS